MNKKASFALRIVLGGYLAWLGIRILLEINEKKPSNTLFMGIMAVVFIIIGGAYAIFSVRQVLKIRKDEMGINENTAENKSEKEKTSEHAHVSRSTSDIKPVELKKEIYNEDSSLHMETDVKNSVCDDEEKKVKDADSGCDSDNQIESNYEKKNMTTDLENKTDDSVQGESGCEKECCNEKPSCLEIEVQSERQEKVPEEKNEQKNLAIEIVENEAVSEETDEEIERDYEEK